MSALADTVRGAGQVLRDAAARRVQAVAALDAALVDAALARHPGAGGADVVDLHLGFMQPGDDALQAQGWVTGGGRSVCFCEAELRDGAGRLVARAMGTLRYRAVAS